MLQDQIKKYWKKYVKKYENITYPGFCLRYFPWSFWWPAKKRLDLLLEYANKNNKVLDAGCGTGWVTTRLIKKGFDVTSVDLSPRSIENTKRIADVTKTKIDLIHCDITDLPFKNNYFKTILSFEVLEHIPNLKKAISELKRVLHPDGLLILSLPNKYGSFSLLEDLILEKIIKKRKNRGIEEHHINLHTLYWWKKYFQKNNLRILKVFNIEYFSPLLAFFGRKKVSKVARLDTKISDLLPKFFASGWLFILKKE